MSYILQIWEHPDGHPLPRNAAEAARCVSALDEEIRDCAQFRLFAQYLTARYPCICSPEIDQVEENKWAWSDGPLDGDSDSAVYGIGLNRHRVDEVRPFVIETALALGLNVLDEARGEFFLATLTKPATDAGKPVAQNYVRRLFLEGLEGILTEYGFTLNHRRGRFERDLPGGFNRIIIPEWDFKTNYPFSLVVSVRFDCINDTVARICGADLTTNPDFYTIIAQHDYFLDRPNHSFAISSTRDMAAAMRVVAITVRTKIMPFFDQLSSLEEFERFINAETTTHERFPMKAEVGLVAASMANPAAFEALAVLYSGELAAKNVAAPLLDRLARIVAVSRAEQNEKGR